VDSIQQIVQETGSDRTKTTTTTTVPVRIITKRPGIKLNKQKKLKWRKEK
jgi:hypothetical protein